MSTSGPLSIPSRPQMRAYLATLAGRRYAWGHLAIKHNSLEYMTPCRFCDGPAQPAEGPAIFWDTDPLCTSCAAQIAPELTLFLATLQALITRMGGDWRDLRPGS